MVYNSKIKDPFLDELFEAILLLNSIEECYRFLKTFVLLLN